MKIQVDEITSVIKQEIAQYSEQLEASEVGRVIAVGDGVTQIYGLATAMAGVGLGTSFKTMKGLGVKPFAVGLVSATMVGLTSIALVFLLGPLIEL